jgi:periplasmic divalent cation tolerance protein
MGHTQATRSPSSDRNEFSRRLVADHLAASVHNLTTIRSIYRWQDEIHDRPEARAAVHTRTALVPRIIERLDVEHPYEVPGVFALPIVATSPAYRAWVLDQTQTLRRVVNLVRLLA